MTVHLVKLCVGVASIEELKASIRRRAAEAERAGGEPAFAHTTRMAPRRVDELLDGGSLYWVIKSSVQARQRIEAIRPFTGADGISRCRIVLSRELVATEWQPRRAFQGWRYLGAADAPPDLRGGDDGILALPPELRRDLADLGLL